MDKPVSRNNPLFCTEYRHARARTTGWDMHYALELGIVLSGTIHRIYRGREMRVGPGGVWLCGMWEPHAVRGAESECRIIVCIIWPPFLAEMYFAEAPTRNWLAPFVCDVQHRPQVTAACRKRFMALGERFSAALHARDSVRKEWLHLLVLETLLEVTGNWKPPRREGVTSGDLLERMNQAITLIFSNSGRITVAQAAARCGISRNRFSVLFRDYMGVSFPDFGVRYRLSRAADQLRNSREPIKRIASAFGFSDESHLHHLFRQHYGLTPRQYRLQSQ